LASQNPLPKCNQDRYWLWSKRFDFLFSVLLGLVVALQDLKGIIRGDLALDGFWLSLTLFLLLALWSSLPSFIRVLKVGNLHLWQVVYKRNKEAQVVTKISTLYMKSPASSRQNIVDILLEINVSSVVHAMRGLQKRHWSPIEYPLCSILSTSVVVYL
jgi:hypothetical protein